MWLAFSFHGHYQEKKNKSSIHLCLTLIAMSDSLRKAKVVITIPFNLYLYITTVPFISLFSLPNSISSCLPNNPMGWMLRKQIYYA